MGSRLNFSVKRSKCEDEGIHRLGCNFPHFFGIPESDTFKFYEKVAQKLSDGDARYQIQITTKLIDLGG
ncbi:hypothetical protein X798_01095 [Onchocerca flexuosa]|uniref:Radical SAM protein n=2 Tax=Onchocerca flexuosa TaxID=387005 RepID=A0A183H5R6_9BILA|nr:hypothetical protein X798_01095 [Onchocerca flexuosa]VDO34356.1 unnamed protein product [Onchocerca flexuosa]